MTTISLDIEQPDALLAYLRAEGHLAPDETPIIERLSGGVSSRTVMLTRQNGEGWVLKQALAKLRVAVDWFSDPYRVHCEAQALRWFGEQLPPGFVPPLLFEDHDAHVIAMAAVPQPHINWKRLMLDGGLKLDHAAAFGRLLGWIHSRSTAQLEEVKRLFARCNFFESLRVEPYYRYTATQVPEAASFISALIADTLPIHAALTHGDFSPKNILIYRDSPVLLDHETAHVGDPAFDVGFSTTHLLSKAHHLSHQREVFAEAAHLHWSTYLATIGDAPFLDEAYEARAVRHTLGCLLARVAGRSPLEYMNTEERRRQREIVTAIMQQPPSTMPDLIDEFTSRL